MKKPAILENVLRSIQLTDSEITFFKSLLKERAFSSKQNILQSGEICREQNYVISGCLKVCYHDDQGEEHIVKFAVEDWWAFDIESFFDVTPAFYSIVCIEDTQVFQLSREGYDKLLKSVPAFEKFYRLMLQNSFIALQHRMTQSLSLSAEERYERFKLKYPGLERRISQKNIASYLGITPVFLSMLRKNDLVKH